MKTSFNTSYLYILGVLLGLLMLTTCSDDYADYNHTSRPDKLTITLRLPMPTVVHTRADGDKTDKEREVKQLQILHETSQGVTLLQTFTPEEILAAYIPESGDYRVTVTLPADASYLHFVLNGNLPPMQNSQLYDILPAFETNFTMWGRLNIAEALQQTVPTAYLYHNIAKVTLQPTDNTDDVHFTIKEWGIYKRARQGTIAPFDYDITRTKPSIPYPDNKPEDEWYPVEEGEGEAPIAEAGSPIYVYEGEAGHNTRIWIKGIYTGDDPAETRETYYTALFRNLQDDEIDLLRNHHYIVTLAKVNHHGYDSMEEALAAAPCNGNELSIEIKDNNPQIYDLVACADYALGVCDTVRVEADATETSDAYLVSNYKGSPLYTAQPEASTTVTCSELSKDAVSGSAYSTDATLVKLKVEFPKNDYSDQPQYHVLHITSGDLKRQIVIEQAGADFRSQHNTYLYGLEETAVLYFGTAEGTTALMDPSNVDKLGVSKEMMRVCRDDGLHFSTINKDYYYTIEKKTNESCTIVSDNNFFTVKDNGSNQWEVRLTTDAPESIDDPQFGEFHLTERRTIDNVERNIVTTYQVYRTGLFHKVDTQYDVDATATATWQYYEQVKLTNGAVLLDRNIGASSNRFYSPYIEGLKTYNSAVGGYYKITDSKDSETNAAKICPEGYIIPSCNGLLNAGVKPQTLIASNGEAYIASALQTQSTAEQGLQTIFFPWGGYMEGGSIINPNNGYYWSSTVLAGNQGFDTSSPEYGYWYRCPYFSATSTSETNIRYENSTGTPKGLSVRCVKEGTNTLDLTLLTIIDNSTNGLDTYRLKVYNDEVSYRNAVNGEKITLRNGKAIYYTIDKKTFPEGKQNLYYKVLDVNNTSKEYPSELSSDERTLYIGGTTPPKVYRLYFQNLPAGATYTHLWLENGNSDIKITDWENQLPIIKTTETNAGYVEIKQYESDMNTYKLGIVVSNGNSGNNLNPNKEDKYMEISAWTDSEVEGVYKKATLSF